VVNDHDFLLDSIKAILDLDLAFENCPTPRVVPRQNWSGKETGSLPPEEGNPASLPTWARGTKKKLSKNEKQAEQPDGHSA